MKQNVRGSFTVEAAVIVPLILMVFMVSLYVLFYYHDKNILEAIAHETAAIGSGYGEPEEHVLESYFAQVAEKRMLLFTTLNQDVQVGKEQVTVVCHASGSGMSVEVECTVKKTEPETYIRNIRKLKKIGEGIGTQ